MSSSRELDFGEFFELYDPLANRPLRLTPDESSEWLKQYASALFGGQISLDRPVRLKAYAGGQATDFLWADYIPLVCISCRTVELLEEHHFTGWATYPVVVYGRKGEPIEGYYGFAITGRAGDYDRSRSQIVTKPPPVPGGQARKVYKGLYFDESQWDGSDIFLVGGKNVVTRAVREAFKRAKITNVRFTPLTEVEIPVYLDRFDKKGS